MFRNFDPFIILIQAFVLLTALPFHEFAHAWMANKLGDPTAKYQGRLTLNPLAHLDIIGTIAMVFIGIGWAKPVPINARNFKNPKVGMAISALAGPVSNILLALIAVIFFKVFYVFNLGILASIFYYIALINCSLGVFNLIPVPPLDGSRIATLFLKSGTYFRIMQYERYIMFGMIILLSSGALSLPISFLARGLITILDKLTFFVDIILKMVV